MASRKNPAYRRPASGKGSATRHGAGRPPIKLNDKVIEQMKQYLRIGAYPETAAVMAGASKWILISWSKQGHKDRKAGIETEYTKFLDALEKGSEEATTRDLLVIDKCANGQEPEYERDEQGNLILNARGNPIIKKIGIEPNWNAAAWRLERRKPKQWGKVEYNVDEDPTGERDDGTLKIEFVDAKK